jgi:cytochrome c oxidase subunit II
MSRFKSGLKRLSSRPIPVLLVALLFVSVSLGGAFLAEAQTAKSSNERVIKVVAKKFAYTPGEIVLKKGQRVVLEFTSVDFIHGFKIPDMNLRADLPPGKVTRVAISADKVGVYEFLCDNFCGSEHEEMSGRIVVKE